MKTEITAPMSFEQKSVIPRITQAYDIRLAAMALTAAGMMFVLYPALRPFSDEASLQGAAAFASTEWIAAHMLAMFAFILLTFGLFGLFASLQETAVERLALRGLVVSSLGIGLTLPFYGAEAFGLHVIGLEAVRQHNATIVSLANEIRFGPGFIMIVAGLLLLAIGSVMAAVAVWKSRMLPRWSGIPFALGFLLYLPQYTASQPIRVAHGLLVAAGCLWIAAAMWRLSRNNR